MGGRSHRMLRVEVPSSRIVQQATNRIAIGHHVPEKIRLKIHCFTECFQNCFSKRLEIRVKRFEESLKFRDFLRPDIVGIITDVGAVPRQFLPDVPELLEICMGIALGVFPAKGGVSPSATVTAIVFQLGFDRQSEQPF